MNLSGMYHAVYNSKGGRLRMTSRAVYNTTLYYFFWHELFSVLRLRRPAEFLVSRQTCSHDPENPGHSERWRNKDCEGDPPITEKFHGAGRVASYRSVALGSSFAIKA